MQIRKDIDPKAFLEAVDACAGSVVLSNDEGDVLYLKSRMSQILFTAMFRDESHMMDAEILLEKPEDMDCLAAFVEAE